MPGADEEIRFVLVGHPPAPFGSRALGASSPCHDSPARIRGESRAPSPVPPGDTMTDALDATLAATLWPTRRSLRFARNAALAVGGALALFLSAKIQVPFAPVPMTLQTLVVLALGAAYGARLATATVALYLLEGLV